MTAKQIAQKARRRVLEQRWTVGLAASCAAREARDNGIDFFSVEVHLTLLSLEDEMKAPVEFKQETLGVPFDRQPVCPQCGVNPRLRRNTPCSECMRKNKNQERLRIQRRQWEANARERKGKR